MSDNLAIEGISTWIAITGAIIGIAGFFFGLIKNEENKRIKRQEIIFPLMDEFEDSKKFKSAKLILDSFVLDPNDPNYPERKNWKMNTMDETGKGYYRKENLGNILRIPNPDNKITDCGEIEIRNSFDSILDFFGKLGYLIHIKMITKKEVIYFEYYIDKIRKNESVMSYIRHYEFDLFALLLYKLGKHDARLEGLVKKYRKQFMLDRKIFIYPKSSKV